MIGSSVRRLDAASKVTGKAEYVPDLQLPGTLTGKVLRSPYPHARILAVDTAGARKVPGVKAVITAADVPAGRHLGQNILAVDKARFIGDEIAAVAAVSEDAAEEAVRAIRVEWEPLPAILSIDQALEEGAPEIHAGQKNNIAEAFDITRGDIQEGFREAHAVCEDEFETQEVIHCALGRHACLASPDPSGRLTVWTPDKSPFLARSALSRLLQIPAGMIRVIQPAVGGGFGGNRFLPLYAICGALALKAGRPVKLVNTREEESTATRPRLPVRIRLRMGVRRDGAITAKRAEVIGDCGAYLGLNPSILEVAACRVDSLYRIRNLETKASLVYTNTTPKGAFRGFGNPQGTFPVETILDALAEEIGMDPVELRLRNAVQAGDVTAHGWKISGPGLTECLKKASAAVGWESKRRPREAAPSPVERGVGIGCAIHVSGNRVMGDFDGSTAIIQLHEDGRAAVITGEGEVGQGSSTTFAQITAETIGIPVSSVHVPDVDTDYSPYGMGAFADRLTVIAGNAVRLAAEEVRKQLFDVAAEMFEARVDELERDEEGSFYVRGHPTRRLTVAQVAGKAFKMRNRGALIGKATFDPDTVMVDPATKYGNISPDYSFAVYAVDLEVHRRTGRVRINKVVVVHDAGTPLNPVNAAGQIEGTAGQGLGFALGEVILRENGQVLNPGFLSYAVPTALDMPDVESLFTDTYEDGGPFGAKGLGETGMAAVAPAVINAVYNAVGVRINKLPASRERLWQLLQRPGGRRSSRKVTNISGRESLG